MATTQDAAMSYAERYMSRLLDIEDLLGESLNRKLALLVEEKVKEVLGTNTDKQQQNE